MAIIDRWAPRKGERKSDRWGQGKRWEVRYRDASGRQRKERCDYKADAVLIEARARLDPRQKAAEMTVADLWDAWIAGKRTLKPKTQRGYRSSWEAHIKPELGTRLVSGLSAMELRQWAARIPSKDAARQAIVVLRGMCELAVEDGLLTSSPVGSLSGGQTARRRVEPVTDVQLDALAASLSTEGCETPFWMLVGCGLRFGEMAGLSPARVRALGGGAVLTIDRTVQRIGAEIFYGSTKTGKPREVPCPAWLAAMLATTGDLAIPAPDGGPWLADRWRAPWDRARKAAGLPTLHTHDLRHTFAARQIEAGVDLKTLQSVMGHAHLSITTDLYGAMARPRLDVIADITRPR